jgi:HK97 family phage major capsid protein|tara:strand:+ start:458 stop:1807 length:1350 start_codon:yes stop_codon:yes gene_type:complete
MKLLDTLVEERAEISESQTGLVQRAADEERDLTETEDASLKDLSTRASELDTRISELRAVQVANLEAAKLRAEVNATDDTETRAVGNVTVINEPLTYAQENRNTSFFADMYASQTGDIDASDRIRRHRQEMAVEYRDGGVANYSALVVPQYLTELAAELARAGKPFANECTKLPLPQDGMSITISRITTGASAAAQTENGAVSETDIDDTSLVCDVKTIASGQQVSRQAIERGSGVDTLIAADMAGAMAVTLEDQILNGSGAGVNLLGLTNVSGTNAITYTDGSPTVAELWPKIQDAIQQVNANRFLGADLIVMHPRRLGFLNAALDSSNRPIILPQSNVPQNAMGTGPAAGYGNTGVQIAGIPVVTSGKVTTSSGSGGNEDEIYVVRRSDMLLFEDASQPAFIRMEETAGMSLTLSYVSYAYYAASMGSRYPGSVSVISGTGLTPPSF